MKTKNYLYIRYLKYGHLTPIFYSILYLHTQIQMDIVNRKTGFKRDFFNVIF